MASQYLHLLAQHGFLSPTADQKMALALQNGQPPPPGFDFVLQGCHIEALRDAYALSDQSCLDLKRAQEQTMLRIEKSLGKDKQ